MAEWAQDSEASGSGSSSHASRQRCARGCAAAARPALVFLLLVVLGRSGVPPAAGDWAPWQPWQPWNGAGPSPPPAGPAPSGLSDRLGQLNSSLVPVVPAADPAVPVLLAFKSALDQGGAWAPGDGLQGWDPLSTSPCHRWGPWEGVDCAWPPGADSDVSVTGWVEGLSLSGRGLRGRLPAALSALTRMRLLNMSHNQLTGPLPEQFSALTALRRVDLSFNNLTGSLPPAWSSLQQLSCMDLGNNSLSGALPWGNWSSLTQLVHLGLADNPDLQDPLPPTDHPFMLTPAGTSVTKPLHPLPQPAVPALPSPSLIAPWAAPPPSPPPVTAEVAPRMTVLTAFKSGITVASWNASELKGWAPGTDPCHAEAPWTGVSCSGGRVTTLSLSKKHLQGPLSPGLGTLTYLTRIQLEDNRMSGTLPPEYSALATLDSFDASSNELVGTLPPAWSALTSLDSLDLSVNRLTSTLPPEWSDLSQLTAIDLSFNRLHGELPAAWSALTQLSKVNLAQNEYRWGEVPPEWGPALRAVTVLGERPKGRLTEGGVGDGGGNGHGKAEGEDMLGTVVGSVVGGTTAAGLLAWGVMWCVRRRMAARRRAQASSSAADGGGEAKAEKGSGRGVSPPGRGEAGDEEQGPHGDPQGSTLRPQAPSWPDAAGTAAPLAGAPGGGAAAWPSARTLSASASPSDLVRPEPYPPRHALGAAVEIPAGRPDTGKRRSSEGSPTGPLQVAGQYSSSTDAASTSAVVGVGLGQQRQPWGQQGEWGQQQQQQQREQWGQQPPQPGGQQQVLHLQLLPATEEEQQQQQQQQQLAAAASGWLASEGERVPSTSAAHAAEAGLGHDLFAAYRMAAGIAAASTSEPSSELGLALSVTAPAAAGPIGPRPRLSDPPAAAAAAAATATQPSSRLAIRSVPQLSPRPDVQLGLDWSRDVTVFKDCKLGRGGQGQVFKGLYKGREVAVKVLNEEEEGAHLLDLQTELQFLARMDHPNIVHVYGGCMIPPDLFVVQELMSCDLNERIHKQSTPLTLPVLLQLALDIARGLSYLHANNIIHRDLKPGNILLDAQGTAKIADFGLARCKTRTYLSTKRPEAGTVIYSAPECFNDELGGLSAKADIFSLGVILGEMASRERPWSKLDYPGQIMYQVSVKHNRPTLPLASERCPPPLLDLIHSCWDKQPHCRPSAQQVCEALEAIRCHLGLA